MFVFNGVKLYSHWWMGILTLLVLFISLPSSFSLRGSLCFFTRIASGLNLDLIKALMVSSTFMNFSVLSMNS